jgi:hypothetical protein
MSTTRARSTACTVNIMSGQSTTSWLLDMPTRLTRIDRLIKVLFQSAYRRLISC